MIKEIAEVIKNSDNFVVASHVGPDGDSLGSTLALGLILKKLGKNYCLAFGEKEVEIPPQYRFLPQIEQIKSHKECFNPDIFFILECPSPQRLSGSNKLLDKAKFAVNIDHHGDNKLYGNINWVEPHTSSTAEMIFRLSGALDVKLDKEIATNLYTGLVTDTGRFQYDNTSASTFETAKELLAYDVNFKEIFDQIYENRSFRSTVLLGEMLSKAIFIKEIGFIYSTVTTEDFLLSGAKMGEIEHFIDFLRSVHGIEIAAIFKEVSKNDIKASLRSKGKIDVAKIAENFGGGGHAGAAGFTSKKSLKETIEELCNFLSAKCAGKNSNIVV